MVQTFCCSQHTQTVAVAIRKLLIFDLETTHPASGAPRITKLGALRSDTGAELECKVDPAGPAAALQRLDALASGADAVLGHNIVDFDLPLLADVMPTSPVLPMPAIDTLTLSPLAFPQNPYHRLVKNYKLIPDALNSPLADCRAAQTLFNDQVAALSALRDYRADEVRCYQALLQADGNPALDALLQSITGDAPLSRGELSMCIPELLVQSDPALGSNLKVCRHALARMLDEDLAEPNSHWIIAYVIAWLRVSGGNSVLAPWVRHSHPRVPELIARLRDSPCGQQDCQYCLSTHDPQRELTRYFGFNDFREEAPGHSLQRDIVLASMRGESVLAVLPTGGGKSLCYQLPALNRYHRNASLTIVVSPLQSLMKDQVDGLKGRNITCAAALNGLLTMPERADVLDRVQMGDVGILLVSPEQFRNRSFRSVIEQRQVGAWVYDEAHCLSKWGNDFRPDYLYVARYIREYTGSGTIAPVCCFTATAKLDVLEDIEAHFREELNNTFLRFIGSPERPNLHFEVRPVARAEKNPAVKDLLQQHLARRDGGAVVFVASRRRAEQIAEFLQVQGWPCAYYHAGLLPNERKDIQDRFLRGELRVIVATNAFGMGVDKQDVRLVVHANIPGSLENYLQEAGRAGRDQHDAWCVLLYDDTDVESQFGLGERSRLQQRDIQQILTKLRAESRRRKGDELVITSGEILLDERTRTSFDADDRDAQTKVATAVAWLERARYLTREVNRTTVFPARLSLDETLALERLAAAELSEARREHYATILHHLCSADADEFIDTDRLMSLTGESNEVVVGALRQLEVLGILENDARLTLYVRHGVVGASLDRLRVSLTLETELLAGMPSFAPDAEEGDWQDVNLDALTTWLRSVCELPDLLPLHVVRLLQSLAQDRDGESQQRSSFELRHYSRSHLKLRIRHGYQWQQIRALGNKRRDIAAALLHFLVGKIREGVRGKDILVETTFGELANVLKRDTDVGARLRPEHRQQAIQHVLLYLHQQEILTLNHGLTVMRRAMTIHVDHAQDARRFSKKDFERLDEHYRERRIQVHVMREYAECGLTELDAAQQLVLHYFTASKSEFLRRYFAGRDQVLSLATSEQSWRRIVMTLDAAQRPIVTDDTDTNRLVLAGPGSGKTRVVVHRVAYLLRVRRVPAESVIVLTFNRHAALEVRERLTDLVDSDAWSVTVMTYHALAMRLTGTSFERGTEVTETMLSSVLERAVELLEGEHTFEGEDDIRERLLRGYRHVLVDEYQDIDQVQYRLVRALTRCRSDAENSLCILAVGDDDQNIYEWRGGSNVHIERFRSDYAAETNYLVRNYRSSAAIIRAANLLIATNADRLKQAQPIRIDEARDDAPEGGDWEERDPIRRGAVQRLRLPDTDRMLGHCQAQGVIKELERLRMLESRSDWNGCAILARSHRFLWPVQAYCEQQGVPYFLAAEKGETLPLTRERGFLTGVSHLRIALETLHARHATLARDRQRQMQLDSTVETGVSTAEVQTLVHSLPFPDQRWRSFFETAFDLFALEHADCTFAPASIIDWFYDHAREMRQRAPAGLFVGTVHAAKGLEFGHVALLDGGWRSSPGVVDQERRLYYVGMTRAQETLTLTEFAPGQPLLAPLQQDTIETRCDNAADPALASRYQMLSLADVDLGYAGRKAPNHAIHQAIATLAPGDPLVLERFQQRYLIQRPDGEIVGRTSARFLPAITIERAEVGGIVVRYRSDTLGEQFTEFRTRLRSAEWEVVVPRIIGKQ